MNLIFISGAPHGTELQEWPKKPDCDSYNSKDCPDPSNRCACADHVDALKEALAKCIPVVESDWEKVKELIQENCTKCMGRGYVAPEEPCPRCYSPVDFTIYKDTGIEFEEVWFCRLYGSMIWDESFCDEASRERFKQNGFEYRRAFRVVETKEI